MTEYDDLEDYALTIDGYRYAEEVWHVQPNSQEYWLKVQSFKKKGRNGSFEDLRACLFAYQRSIRLLESGAFDREGGAEFMIIYRALCNAWENRQTTGQRNALARGLLPLSFYSTITSKSLTGCAESRNKLLFNVERGTFSNR